MQTDFLIIGQGLAGSLLAWELLNRGKRVIVVDAGLENASGVAAGIINPVTGMRWVKTADADSLLPAARQYYGELAKLFNQQFYSDLPMVRFFQSEAERDTIKKKLQDPEYSPYFGEIQYGQSREEFNTPYGAIEQKNTGYLKTKALVNCLKHYFLDRGGYIPADFDYQLIFSNSRIIWREISAANVIFSEGHQVKNNPWFNWLPMQPAKGEILTLSYDKSFPGYMVNFGNWLLPLEPGNIRLGATFDRNFNDALPTPTGRQTLLNRLQPYAPKLAQAELCAHQAGIRPSTLDKAPFLGCHPSYAQISIFNGFGAKGSLLIPRYCRQFADFLIDRKPLPESCDIKRYESTCFPG